MEKIQRQAVKERLLLTFVGASLLLIFVIWGSNLLQGEPAQPEYYRETFEYDLDAIWLTETAIVEDYLQENGVTPTPEPTRAHQSGGEAHDSETPGPTP